MTTTLRAAAVSPEIVLGDVDANVGQVVLAVDEAVARGALLVVAPELALSGYVFADVAEAREAALTRDDPRFEALSSRLPEGGVAVVGYAEIDGNALFNTAAVLTAGGAIAHYRKAHLWGAESLLFAPGEMAGTVIPSPIGLLGIAICYDNEFPEVPRRLALAGADVLALPVNWPLVGRPAHEHPPETIQAMAAARSSRLATVVADRRGVERGVAWTGGTAVIDDDGWIAAGPDETGTAIAEITLRGSGGKSLPPFNDLFIDRRPELY